MNCQLWSVKSELWTVKSPPVSRSFVLNSLCTFIKDIWQAEHTRFKFLGADGSQFCQYAMLSGREINEIILKGLWRVSCRTTQEKIINTNVLHTKIWCLMSELIFHAKMYNIRTHVAHETMMSRVLTYVTYKICIVRTYVTHKYTNIFYPNYRCVSLILYLCNFFINHYVPLGYS